MNTLIHTAGDPPPWVDETSLETPAQQAAAGHADAAVHAELARRSVLLPPLSDAVIHEIAWLRAAADNADDPRDRREYRESLSRLLRGAAEELAARRGKKSGIAVAAACADIAVAAQRLSDRGGVR